MSKVSQAFENGKAFIAFITGGDSNLETTQKLILEIQRSGADLLIVGIPFSDPIAEGSVIQAADLRALNAGCTTDKLFVAIKNIKEQVNIPLVFMTYANVIYRYGTKKFMERCVECAISGVIVPDCPYEEKDEFAPFCDESGIDLITLIAPAADKRITEIAGAAQGFVYILSSCDMTKIRSDITKDLKKITELVKETSDIPCVVGVENDTYKQIADICKYADGVVVGSSIVKIVEEHGKNCIPYVGEYVRKMKEIIRL